MKHPITAAVFLVAVAVARADDVVEIDGLKSKIPAGWKSEKPASNERMAQFRLPKAAGDMEDAAMFLFYFGKGKGGPAKENIDRWQKMIDPPKGKTADDVSKVETFKVGDMEVTLLTMKGSYKQKKRPFDPNEEPTLKPDYCLMAAILATPNGPYFLRLTGPVKTVESHQKALVDWLKNFK
jgi:hypothetical protein